ncbi:MAG: hypothetical protein R2789_11520 [Microthrixaceae bacterium]
MAWAIDQTERVNRLCDLDVSLSTQVFSPGLGTIVWSAPPSHSPTWLVRTRPSWRATTTSPASTRAPFLRPPTDGAVPGCCTLPDDAGGGFNARPGSERCSPVVKPLAALPWVWRSPRPPSESPDGRPCSGTAVAGTYGGVGWITVLLDRGVGGEGCTRGARTGSRLLDSKAGGLYAEVPEVTTQRVYRRIA